MLVWLLAWRYASRRAVNYVAVAAIAVALMVQIVAAGVIDGQLVNMERRVHGLGQHVTARFLPGQLAKNGYVSRVGDPENPAPYWDPPDPERFDEVARAVRALPGVLGVAPILRHEAAMRSPRAGHASDYVFVQGIDLAAELKASKLARFAIDFRPDPENPSWYPPHLPESERDRPGIFVGKRLAQTLGLEVGDLAELFYREPDAPADAPVERKVFRVTNRIASGWPEVDSFGVYAPIDEVTGLFFPRYRSEPEARRVMGLAVWLDEPFEAAEREDDVARAVFSAMPDAQLRTDSWIRRWSDLANGMKHENGLVELVLGLFTFSTGFCVFAILSTLVSRRLRDMGLLRCLGATRRTVLCAFLSVGLLIGLAGAAIGTAAGCLLLSETAPAPDAFDGDPGRVRIDLLYEKITGEPMYPLRMFGVGGLTVDVRPWKVAGYAAGAVLVAVLAGLYPALWAASREPARVMVGE